MSYELTLPQLAGHLSGADDATAVLTDLRREVGVIIAFYFGSDAAISVAKSIGISAGAASKTRAIMTSDRDVAAEPKNGVTKPTIFSLRSAHK